MRLVERADPVDGEVLDRAALHEGEAVLGRRQDADGAAVEEALAIEARAGRVGGDGHGGGIAAVDAESQLEDVGLEGGVGEEIGRRDGGQGDAESGQGRARGVLRDLEADEVAAASQVLRGRGVQRDDGAHRDGEHDQGGGEEEGPPAHATEEVQAPHGTSWGFCSFLRFK